jgi:hypothetical protein
MFRMIGDVVAGARMGEDGEAVAVERDPLRKISELLGPDRQLAASPRVRSDRSGVETPNRNSEPLTGRFGDTSGAIQLIGIEIDMRVEIADDALGHGRPLHQTRGNR